MSVIVCEGITVFKEEAISEPSCDENFQREKTNSLQDDDFVLAIDSSKSSSACRASGDGFNSTENRPNATKAVSQAESLNEDFIVVENPDFNTQPNNSVSHDVAGSHVVTGVESSVLPPPRTLDDMPRRGGRRKGVVYKNSRKRKLVVVTSKSKSKSKITSNTESAIQSSQQAQLEEIESNIEKSPSLNSEENITAEEDITANENVEEVPRSTSSYGLRRKFRSIDYSFIDDSLSIENSIENEERMPVRTFFCSECDLICTTRKELKQHEVFMHGKSKDHKCDQCGNDFTTLLGLQKHIALKHCQTECPQCNKQFKVGQALIDHVETCGQESVSSDTVEGYKIPKLPKPKVYPCSECGKKFSERGNRRRHMRIHQGILRFSCDICGKKCSEKSALLSHIRHIHTGERPYACDKCPTSFTTQSDLSRHKNTVHTDERKFSCSDCGKSFKTNEALKNHIKFKSGEKLWECGVCNVRFVTKGGLKAHMVKHSGIKMYECETCEKQFTHKASLEAHVRVHTGHMPYVCPSCGRKFAHLSNRNRHVKTCHLNEF